MQDWIGLCSVLRPLQHSIGYMGHGIIAAIVPAWCNEGMIEHEHSVTNNSC